MTPRSPAPTGLAALALLVLVPATAGAQFRATDVRPVASGSGVRDHPAVVTSLEGYSVFWNESRPFGTPARQPLPAWIMRLRIRLDGTDAAPADTVALGGGIHFRPAPAVGNGISWLAWDFQEPGMRAGDRDLGLIRYDGFFEVPGPLRRLTREPPPGPPTTQSAPALLHEPEGDRLLLANTWGVRRMGRGRGVDAPIHDSISVEIRTLGPDGSLRERFTVKGPDEAGEAAHPFLAFLPPGWRERYILAYTSNGGRRDLGAAGHSVYLELFGADWRVLGGRHMAWPVGGASHPSVATVGGKLYLAWAENATGEVMLSELSDELWPRRPMRLRDALADTEFGNLFALDHPRLGAPMLFDDFGMLGVVFVATLAWQPGAGRARQEVWMARLAVQQ